MIGTACVVSYYASIMGLTVYYFFASFQTNLPWSVCDENWIGLGTGFDKDMGAPILTCNDSDRNVAFNITDGSVSSISVAQLYFEYAYT